MCTSQRGGAIQSLGFIRAEPLRSGTVAESIEFGRQVYSQSCVACHQSAGTGIPGVFPPLASSDLLNGDAERSIRIVISGLSGPITVNGAEYDSTMPGVAFSDQEVADLLTYVYSEWGNSGAVVLPEQVSTVRAQIEGP